LLVSEIAGKILEAVKIDGFDKGDAAEAAKLLKQLEGAGRREATQLHDELRGLYGKNYKAVKSWESRQKA
jgi:Holliday junction resolvasome RuvABC DNA-binding subunit